MNLQTKGSNVSPDTQSSTTHLASLSDDELVITAKRGSDLALEFLLNKYKSFVKLKARSYFLVGADKEDLLQEGMIGLYKAIRDFRKDKETSFRAFAELCITRQIITAIKTATRQKHIPLNSYISLNKPAYAGEDSDRELVDTISGSENLDPARAVISDEELRSLRINFGKMLSGFETQVLRLYIDGKSYQEIAEELNRRVKSIDNALQRVKRKLGLHMRCRRTYF